MEAKYSRPATLQALATDKTILSRLLKRANRQSGNISEAICPASIIGRPRWAALGRAWERHAAERPVDLVMKSDNFLAPPSNARLELLSLYSEVFTPKPQARNPGHGPRRIISQSGRSVGTPYVSPKNFMPRLEAPLADGFGAFLYSRLKPLYENYAQQVAAKAPSRHSVGR